MHASLFISGTTDGVPLALREITSSSLFRPQVLPNEQVPYGIHLSNSAFAMLSQGDHPVLGIPCWYLHPCHTADVVGEILNETEIGEKEYAIRYLEAWFMVMNNLVTLDHCSMSST